MKITASRVTMMITLTKTNHLRTVYEVVHTRQNCVLWKKWILTAHARGITPAAVSVVTASMKFWNRNP